MKRLVGFVMVALLLAFAVSTAQAAVPTKVIAAQATGDTLARGAKDGKAPAWAIDVVTPAGWTRDCCKYARGIGVDAVLYRGDWTGKPQRVMVLNVWPRKLPTLQAELDADRKHYLQLDPDAKASSFPIPHAAMPCRATVYEGSDHVDDVVAFCDPGTASGVRLSWSMSFNDNDPERQSLLDDFMDVVVATHWRRDSGVPHTAVH
ncbi:hypothetical protein [Dyella sp. A6]|uniref:hypothetical protein n=1 Tax=Dyella aluminiiresistens TaxID=3069105 RepID=UPI002E7A5A1C|nr:hypothetical protein [Dyella sp. A6]